MPDRRPFPGYTLEEIQFTLLRACLDQITEEGITDPFLKVKELDRLLKDDQWLHECCVEYFIQRDY